MRSSIMGASERYFYTNKSIYFDAGPNGNFVVLVETPYYMAVARLSSAVFQL